MNINIATLALVTFTALATACDPEPAASSEAFELREGEIVVTPTRPIGGGLTTGGGHDNPVEVLQRGFDLAPIDIQISFLAEIEQHILKVIKDDFLADERTYEECPWQCAELNASWDEGVYVTGLRYEHGEVTLAEDALGPHWQTDVSYEAEVGCGCI